MIDGTEPIHQQIRGAIHDGISFKQQMVIEFTKAFITNMDITRIGRLGTEHWSAVVGDAISISDEVIKQLNEEQ